MIKAAPYYINSYKGAESFKLKLNYVINKTVNIYLYFLNIKIPRLKIYLNITFLNYLKNIIFEQSEYFVIVNNKALIKKKI